MTQQFVEARSVPSVSRSAWGSSMRGDSSAPHLGEGKGMRRLEMGSTLGMVAGAVGLALPFVLFLWTSYGPYGSELSPADWIRLAAVLTLGGAILFAVSLLLYRSAFSSLRAGDARFWVASILCMLGTVGVILLVLPMALAFLASGAMANCIQGAPTKALVCLDSAAPLASFLGTAGFWLLWLGGLGIVVGISLTSVRYRQPWLTAGAALYALILLALVGPLIGPIARLGGPQYEVLALPLLVLLAPIAIYHGARCVAAAPRVRTYPVRADPTVG